MIKRKKIKGFTLIELLVVIAVIGILTTIILPVIKNGQLRAKNAGIVTTMSNIEAAIDIAKYPGTLEELCDDFEPGGELSVIREGVEDKGGIWHCDSTESDFRIFAKLNQGVVLASNPFGKEAFAESGLHGFGNYYCVNSKIEKNFTHWSGDNLAYPSCNDDDYIETPVDPEPTPEPTPDPDPEPVPDPVPSGNCSGNKVAVCHFGNTLCEIGRAHV